MKPRVYVETTIPSFYFEQRREPSMVARREWTQTWWQDSRQAYEAVTSHAVLDELRQGEFPNKSQCLALIENLPLVQVEPAILEIAQFYIDHQLMPRDPLGDALHLALASYNKCDFLLTWNCRHLANANKFGHIRRLNSILGLVVPSLVTPLELLEEEPPNA